MLQLLSHCQATQYTVQVLDVQQARGTLEDVSTNLHVAVLSRFANFGVSDPNPPTPSPIPRATSNPKPTVTSASNDASPRTPRSGKNTAGPGELLIIRHLFVSEDIFVLMWLCKV